MTGTPGIASTLNAYEGGSVGADLGAGSGIVADAAGGPDTPSPIPQGIQGTVEEALLPPEGVSAMTLTIVEGLATMIGTSPFAPSVDLSPPGESD